MIEGTRWSQWFLGSLAAIGLGGNALTGRRSALAGEVLSLSLSKSIVVGSLRTPDSRAYRVQIAVRAFEAGDWARIERELATRTMVAARLLAGEVPAEIRDVFDELDLPLFPRTTRDIAMSCSCPDWQVPCKHLAAICHHLAARFDANPFDVLAWRGRDRDDLLERLISLRTNPNRRDGKDPAGSRPLAECVEDFWAPAGVATPSRRTAGADKPVLLLHQAKPPALTIDGRPVEELLGPVYRAITG